MLILVSIFKLDHVLDEVVSVWIFDQLVDVFDDVIGQRQLLLLGALLEAPLHHAAAVLVLSDWYAVVNACLENEISVLAGLVAADAVLVLGPLGCLEHHEQGLDHVVSVHVDGQVNNLLRQLTNNILQNLIVEPVHLCELESLHVLKPLLQVAGPFDDVNLRVNSIQNALGKALDEDLNDPRSVNVERYLNNVVRNVIDQVLDRCWIRNFHDALAQVVSKLIDHDVRSQWEHEVNQAIEECLLVG